MTLPTIRPDWRAPPTIEAWTTTRLGGVSEGALASLNLGLRSGDDPLSVEKNRARVNALLPQTPHWLRQVHGARCVEISEPLYREEIEADASWTTLPNVVLAVLTADCLPVFFCDSTGTRVGIAHAGWRGLSTGILEATVKAMSAPGLRLIAHLGPAIGPQAFEVGPEVREAFIQDDPNAKSAFKPGRDDRFWADLYQLARFRLSKVGIDAVTGGEHCTFREHDLFFSHRRDAGSGRMASLIWRRSSL